MSLALLIASIFTIILIFKKVRKLTKKLNSETLAQFNEKFSPLTESLKESFLQKSIYFMRPLYLLRWVVTLVILIVL